MSRGTRLFLVFLLVALPPLVLLGVLETVADSIVAELGQGTTLLAVGLSAAAWASIVVLFVSRSFGDEVRALVDLAERGVTHEPDDDSAQESAAFRRLSAVLDERNAQLAELVEHLRAAPISEDIGLVARSMVQAARSVTRNPTWTLAILGADAEAQAPAVYGGPDDAVSPPQELHRWAAASGDDPTLPRLIEGPWGRFLAVPVGTGASEGLRALLLSPWEGRAAPSGAEMNLLQLLGEHAAAAIEHAMLFGELSTRTEQLNRMAAIQTDFLRGVTHDLQTPLTSIRALASELEAGPHADASAQVDLQTIAYQADRLRRMVGQLLVVSRLEAGAVTPRQEIFRVEPIIDRTWQALRAVDRTFELRSAASPFLVVADPDRLEQVLWALLDNAIKYSPERSPIAVEITTKTAGAGLEAELAVIDHGPGMDAETLEHAFDQFYRASSARRDAPDGSGIGLYAARGLVEAMGGRIRIERSERQETRVVITLPAEPVSEPGEGSASV